MTHAAIESFLCMGKSARALHQWGRRGGAAGRRQMGFELPSLQGLAHASAGNRVDDGGQLRVEVSLLVLQNIPVASSSLHLGSGGKGAGGQSQLNKMSGPAAQGQVDSWP